MSGKTDKKKRHVALYVIVGILLLAVVTVGVGYGYYHSKIALMQYDDGKPKETGSISDEEAAEDDLDMQEAAKGLEETEAVLSEKDVAEDEGVFNVLLIGTDERVKEFSDNARGRQLHPVLD
jgi:hypothetical protein